MARSRVPTNYRLLRAQAFAGRDGHEHLALLPASQPPGQSAVARPSESCATVAISPAMTATAR